MLSNETLKVLQEHHSGQFSHFYKLQCMYTIIHPSFDAQFVSEVLEELNRLRDGNTPIEFSNYVKLTEAHHEIAVEFIDSLIPKNEENEDA